MKKSLQVNNLFALPRELDIFLADHIWAAPVSLMHDEIFSSWFVRAALANGCDPLTFADVIWPKWRVWTMDVDREISEERLKCLAGSSGVPVRSLEASALLGVASLVGGKHPPKNNFWCWILTIGARNRKRSGGLQYCPTCLAADRHPYFRKHWRYAWHTACGVHGNILLDRCQGCGAAIQPHRLTAEMKSLTVCPVCCGDLRDGQTYSAEKHAVLFQQSSDEILSGQNKPLHGRDVTIQEWFAVTRFYWGLVRRIMDNRTESLNLFGRNVGIKNLSMRPGIPSIEQARTMDRHAILGGVFRIINLRGSEMRAHLDTALVTLQAFCPGRVQLPSVLTEIAAGLKNTPVTRNRRPQEGQLEIVVPKPRKTVEKIMQRLIDRGAVKL